jgi:16S rRNA (guanine(527)-N(7))-methyltransferase RsmG
VWQALGRERADDDRDFQARAQQHFRSEQSSQPDSHHLSAESSHQTSSRFRDALAIVLGAPHLLDAGTGAGFPGIPLALALPDTHFTLAESVQKKARFVESVLDELKLTNAVITPRRAEELNGIGLITARALAPIPRTLSLFGPALKAGANLLLYKGLDAAQGIAEAAAEARKIRARMKR